MNYRIAILLILCFLQGTTIFAQASWNYTVSFQLADAEGKTIDGENYTEKGIKLFSMPFGAHSDSELIYDSAIKKFKFTQHTIVTESALVFVQENDSTKIRISTNDLHVNEIKLTGKIYKIDVWKDQNKFIKNYKSPNKYQTIIHTNKLEFEDYEVENMSSYFKKKLLEELTLVELNGAEKNQPTEYEIQLANNRKQLTKNLKHIFSTHIRAIYPIESNQYFIIQEYSSGNGNHYYDNISLTYVSIGDNKIFYHPLELPKEHTNDKNKITHQIDDNGSLVFTQHQAISILSPISISYDYETKTISYQYAHYESISVSDKTHFVKGAYIFANGKLRVK